MNGNFAKEHCYTEGNATLREWVKQLLAELTSLCSSADTSPANEGEILMGEAGQHVMENKSV